ncbi:hypothetical protein RJ640_028022, partial [Escallonia rubra]
ANQSRSPIADAGHAAAAVPFSVRCSSANCCRRLLVTAAAAAGCPSPLLLLLSTRLLQCSTLPSRANMRKANEAMRLIVTTFIGVVFGFFFGVSFPTLQLTKMNLPSSFLPSIDLTYIEDKYSGLSTQALLNVWSSLKGRDTSTHRATDSKIWIPTNPRGAERLPPGIVASESDFYLRRLWGLPSEPRYLVTFTVGYDQKDNIDKAVKKFSENFTILLFHYDGRTTEWNEFEWSKRAIHVSARKQTKWWYAKRFLHPDIVALYDYIFIWDEDLGVDNFDAEEYIKLVRKHGLDISQPGLAPNSGLTWQMTKRRDDTEVHKFVEIMAPVFSRDAWRCVWHMIQNDLVHGWGLDFALRKCVEPAHEKIGVVDAQWIVHQTVPTLGNQVRERCKRELTMFQDRMVVAERAYFKAVGIDPPNSTTR